MQSDLALCLKPFMCTGLSHLEVVVYDNSCHAMTYALNKELAWFQDVQWVIDATHFLVTLDARTRLTSSVSLACCGSTRRFVSRG